MCLQRNLIGILTDLFPESILAKVSGLTGVGDRRYEHDDDGLNRNHIDHYSYAWVFGAAVSFRFPQCGTVSVGGRIRPISLTEIYGGQIAGIKAVCCLTIL